MKINVTEKEALEGFGAGIDCAAAVFSSAADCIGFDKKTAIKLASAFGGGMWHGETCGCVTGALMALGYQYGNAEPGDTKAKEVLLVKKSEFEEAFSKENGGLLCRDILGYDLTIPEQMAKITDQKLLETVCPKLVCSACKILEGIL